MSSKLLLVSIVALVGCSKTAPENASVGTSGVSVPAATKSACDLNLVTAKDVVGLLSEPVVRTKNIPGDPQSCEMETAGFSSVTVTLRPGHGINAIQTYTSGKMDAYEKSEPLSGVGDQAVRSLGLNRVIARKGDLLCEITGPGLSPPAGDPAAVQLANLCNKILNSYRP
jgi:hypothetical protein